MTTKERLFALGDRKLLKYEDVIDKGIWLLKGIIIGIAMAALMCFVLI